MKYLISFDTGKIKQDHAAEWGVDEVLTLESDLKAGLTGLPQDKGSVVWYIPTVLDYNNSLSYDGADLALRILMRYLGEGKTDVDVVLLGNESAEDFMLHYAYPNILKIPGFHYSRFNKKLVSTFVVPHRDYLKGEDYIPFLNDLGLKFPSSFKSTHSLTNEWCQYKWNAFMGFDENASTLEGYLYFDYLITLERLNRVKNKPASDNLKGRINALPNSRILLIDDKEGWHKFFRDFFSYSTNVKLHCLGEDFSKLRYEDIEKRIKAEVNEFNPEVIILDFRLMEDQDAEIKDDMTKISGYKVLSQVLKGTYKESLPSYGRQVVVFTATSRIENILMLKAGNADGFILKEKPENYNGKEVTKGAISKMVTTLEKAVNRSKFLMPLNEKLDDLIRISIDNNANISKDLSSYILNVSYTVRQLIQHNDIDKEVLQMIFLSIFNIFEEIKRDTNFVEFVNGYTLVVRGTQDLKVSAKSACAMSSNGDDDWNYKPLFTPSSRHEKFCKDKDLKFAICALILFRLGKKEINETDWNDIRLIRNAIAHNDQEKLKNNDISYDDSTLEVYCEKMLDLLADIIDFKKIKEVVPILK